MENVENSVGDLIKGRGGDDGVFGNAVAANRQGGDRIEVGGSDQSGVALELNQLPRANQDGSEFQYGEPLTGSGRHRRLHVEEGDFVSVLAAPIHGFLSCRTRRANEN